MLESEARRILGAGPSASFADLKKSYRQFALVMHPDRAGNAPELKAQAEVAMANLNRAWTTIEERNKAGQLGMPEVAAEEPSFARRMPGSSECFICGYSPAIYFKAPSVSTLWIFFRMKTYEGNACKNCGLTMSRVAMRDALRKGWWGLGLLAMPWIIYRWLKNERLFKALENPSRRDPTVYSLIPSPASIVRSPLKDPISILASLAAIAIFISTGFSNAPPNSSVGFGGGSGINLSADMYALNATIGEFNANTARSADLKTQADYKQMSDTNREVLGKIETTLEKFSGDLGKIWGRIPANDDANYPARSTLKSWELALTNWLTMQKEDQTVAEACLADPAGFIICATRNLQNTYQQEIEASNAVKSSAAAIQAWFEKYPNQNQ